MNYILKTTSLRLAAVSQPLRANSKFVVSSAQQAESREQLAGRFQYVVNNLPYREL